MEPLLADGVVILYLLFQKLAHILDIDALGKLDYLTHVQHAAIGLAAVDRRALLFQKHLAVFLDEHDVRVEIGDAQADIVRVLVQMQVDIQQLIALGLHDGHGTAFHELRDPGNLVLFDVRKDLKLLVGIADRRTGGYGGGDALEPARVGDYNAFYVFNDVAAYDDIDLIRHCAEHRPCLRGGIGHGDWLGAAHRRDKLLTQDLQIL